jgi:anthranilate/para-aminobenzoate synthase component II
MTLPFRIHHTDGLARVGVLSTAHGDVRTPAFMPVGTAATVKGLTPEMVADRGKIEITSQNHGFVVCSDGMTPNVEVTHISLFDGSIEGIRLRGKPVFSVQYHPESSPGPHDSVYLFDQFVEMMRVNRAGKQ